MDLQLTVHPSSVAGPGGYGRGQEGYGGPGERLNSNNDYNDGDRYNSGNNEGGYGGGNGRHGHSSGTSYGGVPGGDDDYSSAASDVYKRQDELRNHGQSGYGFVHYAVSSDGLTTNGTS